MRRENIVVEGNTACGGKGERETTDPNTHKHVKASPLSTHSPMQWGERGTSTLTQKGS